MSVVIPFRGDLAGAGALVESLGRLRRESGDELIVADNTPVSVIPDDAMPGLRVVRVPAPQSARRARNEGARVATNPWLLFLDADCRPVPELLDEYFASQPAERCGVIAGEVVGDPGQAATLAQWARSRRGEMARYHLETGSRPAGIAGNLMLRTVSFWDVGGFEERARSEADVDLCWRVQAAGWTLEYRPRALVTHRDPERLRGVLRQARMYGAGRRWLHKRWGSAAPPPPVVMPLARALGGIVVWTLTARFERALFKLVDGLVSGAGWLGYAAARVRGVG